MPGTRDVGTVLRELRRRAGLTQQEAADLAGISVAGLRDVEQGRVATPRARTIRRLGSALGLSAAELSELVELSRSRPDDEVWIGVLGPLVLRVDGADVDLGSETQRVLLGLLALSPNTPVSRHTLLEAMWGDDPPGNLATVLPTRISRLRRRLRPGSAGVPGPELSATGGGYRLAVSERQLDLLAFRSLLTQARQRQTAGELDQAADRYAEALALWRGEPLAGLTPVADHPAATGLTRQWQAAVVEYAAVAVQTGRADDVLPLLHQLVAAEPLHEVAHARLMLALAASGQQAAALTLFDQLRRRLADELGASPGRELSEAHLRVLRQQVPRPDVAPVRAHRQLPPDIADFCGRRAALRWLVDRLPATGPDGTPTGTSVTIYTIEGMGGVGKTRLAVHAAHQLLAGGRYADIQLYVDLHGHATEPPADPAAVLASFLQLLGVPGDQVPPDLAGRSALYRDRLYGRRALVLLDNAFDESQVRPLLPASAANLVLVTSRRTLALDGAHTLALDVFSHQEADDLLRSVIGPERVRADPAAAYEIVERCGRLPLAVALVARRLLARPAWTLGDLATRLADDRQRLAELAAGTRALRAVFDLSYQALEPAAQRVFRLLGAHPGEDATAESVAALADTTPAAARRLLDLLVDEHLVTASPGHRYRLHDLLRDYAVDLSQQDDPAALRAAVGRVLTWYAAAAAAAQERLFSGRELPTDRAAGAGQVPEFTDDDQAFTWLSAEYANLLAAVSAALDHEFWRLAWQLPAALRHFFLRAGGHQDWVRAAEAGLIGARHCGDRHGEVLMLNDLGAAHGNLDEHERSVDLLTQAVDASRSLPDRVPEARSRNNLGIALNLAGRPAEALAHLERALTIVRELAEPALAARTLSNLGHTQLELGQHRTAIDSLQAAAALQRGVDPVGWANSLTNLGAALRQAGRPEEAVAALREACAVLRDKQARGDECGAQLLLAQALADTGDHEAAAGCRRRARVLHAELDGSHPGHAEAEDTDPRTRPVRGAG